MRQSITGYAIFNANKMLRQQLDSRAVIIMESDADLSIVDAHIEQSEYRLAPGHGKIATLEAGRLHREAGDKWVACFVDRDFDNAGDLEDVNVFCTEAYDLDAEVFFGCRRLFARFARTHRGEDCRRTSEDLYQEVVDIAAAVGVVRHVAIEQQLGISMAKFPVSQLHNDAHGTTFVARALTVSIGRGGLDAAKAQYFEARSISLHASLRDRVDYCNGHDLISATALVLSAAGPLNPRPPEFAASFRAAIGCNCFKELSVYAKIATWATAHGLIHPWECDEQIAS